jgi:hypothetical protein
MQHVNTTLFSMLDMLTCHRVHARFVLRPQLLIRV